MSAGEIIPFIAVLCATGLIAGVLAGLLGVGGGIVIVPVLYTLFGLIGINDEIRMHMAVGTSLSTIILTSLSSMWAHLKRKSLDTVILRSWGIWIVVGAIAGTVLAGNVSGHFLSTVFAIIAFLMSMYMLFTSPDFRVTEKAPTGAAKAVCGITISGASAIMGIGGGTMFVPFFNAFGVPVHKSVGTAAGIGLLIALPATTGFIVAGLSVNGLPIGSLGYVSLIGMILLVPFTMIAAPLGAKIAHLLSPIILKRAFGCFLLITSLRMAVSLI
ncbi:sulfite exporter TauE/SafE family protein [Kineobactrum salinum]|uniref:Probable membrane transporter protein n=1 Tax=Kineobactrum salinum TaxID=2708301 RepID=A0A6C0U3V8_9GAMM|nr:sulfite exporter TauE/SafE family protein [Kineobactrum salinum]QIB65045.1 sulfite exporter TauE/SafE family protein [Kineobactrum salinum]